MTLTKADLVKELYLKHDNFTMAEATDAVEAFLHVSKNTLIAGNDLLLSGFGKFQVKDKGGRRGRNPQTGDDLMIAPRRVVTFKPSGLLREKVND